MSSAAEHPVVQAGPPAPTPTVELFGLYTGMVVTQLIEFVGRHGIARELSSGPRTSSELAEAAGVHEPSLRRVLRTMAGLGVFRSEPDGRWSLGRLGEAAAGWGSLPWCVEAWNALPEAIATGATAMEISHGALLFDFLAEHPEQGAAFDGIMTLVHGSEKEAVAEAFDFSGVSTLVDVGGGNGTLLSSVLARNPDLRGVLFDLPQVVERGASMLGDMRDRCDLAAGDMFEAVPRGGDAYVLSHIIHDWDEERCLAVLRSCRSAMEPGARLLVVEMVIPPGDEMHPGKMIDMLMISFTGGMERTEEEYRTLLARAGFRLERVVPTMSPVSVLEALPA
jgi:O-methyltransferase